MIKPGKVKIKLIGRLLSRILLFPKYILKLVFRFDSWHVSSHKNREYSQFIVDYYDFKGLNVLEVGCGLGDTLNRIDARSKYGLDFDKGAIRAAKLLLFWKKIDFIWGNVFELVSFPSVDCVIKLNFLHGYPSTEVRELMLRIFSKDSNIDFLICDGVNLPGYQFAHDFTRMKLGKALKVTLIADLGTGRILYEIRRIKKE